MTDVGSPYRETNWPIRRDDYVAGEPRLRHRSECVVGLLERQLRQPRTAKGTTGADEERRMQIVQRLQRPNALCWTSKAAAVCASWLIVSERSLGAHCCCRYNEQAMHWNEIGMEIDGVLDGMVESH